MRWLYVAAADRGGLVFSSGGRSFSFILSLEGLRHKARRFSRTSATEEKRLAASPPAPSPAPRAPRSNQKAKKFCGSVVGASL